MAHHEQQLRADPDGNIYQVVLVDGVEDPARTIPDPHGRAIRPEFVFQGMTDADILAAYRVGRR